MGRTRIVDSLPRFVAERQARAAGAMTQVLVLGAAEAATLTPIDTSNLLNSQYREVGRDGTRVTGRVGYTAEYALPVHDPDHPQNFRRSTAEKEFLSKGFERQEPAIRGVIKKAMAA